MKVVDNFIMGYILVNDLKYTQSIIVALEVYKERDLLLIFCVWRWKILLSTSVKSPPHKIGAGSLQSKYYGHLVG